MLEVFHGVPYAICVELKNFYLFVFCFEVEVLRFVSCVAVCRCGDMKSWDGCFGGGGGGGETINT